MALSSASDKPTPLPARLVALLRESRLLLLLALAAYILLVLYGYDRSDPGWSHSTDSTTIHNPGGAFGAGLADILLYVFGFSAWWWAVFLIQRVWAGYRGMAEDSLFDRRVLWVALCGFLVLLLASSSLEALRLYSLKVALPNKPGGMLGEALGNELVHVLGFTGSTIFLLALIAAGFSLFTGLSWLRFVDWVGSVLESGYFRIRLIWQTWQDRRIGTQALSEREAVVEVEKKRVEEHQPIVIESPFLEVPQSTRMIKEKQVPLFADLPDSPLPPLHLLDQPAHEIEVLSAETLEFTSRLIERKLMDFGVEVRVVAAYPGPIITRYEIDPAVGVKGSQIVNLVKDLARALSVVSIRVVETIPGKAYMALELPNPKRQMVKLVRDPQLAGLCRT